MDRLVKLLRQVHEEYLALKSTGQGMKPSQRATASCKRNAFLNHEKTLAAIEAKNLSPVAKQSAIKAAKENLASELAECER